MKALSRWLILVVGMFCIAPATATSVGFGTIEQPINLGAASDPSSIPLGPVVYESNYNYGIHKLITSARPCQHGAMEWSGGSELDQNLAHVFGISIKPEDPTQINYAPVVIHLKNWKAPDYSPYSRDQVLAATLHCLLRSATGTPAHPIVIKIKAEDKNDLIWAKKFEGNYINNPDRDGSPITATPIHGTQLTTDKLGVTYVQFPKVLKKPHTPPPSPILIPFHLSDDGDSWVLLPVWVGNTFKSPLDAIGQPYSLMHNVFNPSAPSSTEINALFINGGGYHWSVSESPNKTHLGIFTHSSPEPADLFAALHAIIQSVQPTSEKPLEISLQTEKSFAQILQPFLSKNTWKETKLPQGSVFSSIFELNPLSGALTKGNVPLLKINRPAARNIYLDTVE